jgi:hypothetical protein
VKEVLCFILLVRKLDSSMTLFILFGITHCLLSLLMAGFLCNVLFLVLRLADSERLVFVSPEYEFYGDNTIFNGRTLGVYLCLDC